MLREISITSPSPGPAGDVPIAVERTGIEGPRSRMLRDLGLIDFDGRHAILQRCNERRHVAEPAQCAEALAGVADPAGEHHLPISPSLHIARVAKLAIEPLRFSMGVRRAQRAARRAGDAQVLKRQRLVQTLPYTGRGTGTLGPQRRCHVGA